MVDKSAEPEGSGGVVLAASSIGAGSAFGSVEVAPGEAVLDERTCRACEVRRTIRASIDDERSFESGREPERFWCWVVPVGESSPGLVGVFAAVPVAVGVAGVLNA